MGALLMVMLAAPPELGLVRFGRGYDAAAARARESGKPMFVLFDEVPGCSTVLAFGDRVLSHPLIADAIEESFVPVAVYNNVSGDDREVLERFKEPAWNNPVVRIISREGRTLSRIDTGSVHEVASAMVKALGDRAPLYLSLLAQEAPASEKILTMGCFWEGERSLGALDGVLSTQTGFARGHEAVRVTYDPRRIDLEAFSRARGYVEAEGFSASVRDDKYQIRDTALRHVPMTALQKARINADASNAQRYLSPRQLQILKREGGPDLIDEPDIVEAYKRYMSSSTR